MQTSSKRVRLPWLVSRSAPCQWGHWSLRPQLELVSSSRLLGSHCRLMREDQNLEGKCESAAIMLQGHSTSLSTAGKGEMFAGSSQCHKARQRKVNLELRDNKLITVIPKYPPPYFYNC